MKYLLFILCLFTTNLFSQDVYSTSYGTSLSEANEDAAFFINSNSQSIYWYDGSSWQLKNPASTSPTIVTGTGNIDIGNGSTIWIRTGGIVSTFVSGTPSANDKFKFRCLRVGSCGFNISGTPDFVIDGTTYTAPDLIGLAFGSTLIFEMSDDGKIYGEIK